MYDSKNIFRRCLVLLLIGMLSSRVFACPFCSAVSLTFSEEIATMDIAVICQLTKLGKYDPTNNTNPDAEIPMSVFTIKQVIKGKEFVKVDETFECVYFGEAKMDRPFLAMAMDAPNPNWSTPLILTDRAEQYLGELDKLNAGQAQRLSELQANANELASSIASKDSKSDSPSLISAEYAKELEVQKQSVDAKLETLKLELGIERLAFFQNHLEDEDEMLARDAYDEFAKAPYDQVQGLKPKMDHKKLIQFLNDPDVPSNRRRLYFTMLGVCGTEKDAKMLEEFMDSDDRKKKAGLDALLACYLILTGEKGLDRVDNRFLKNTDAEYADTYAAIMAIRFHGSEIDVLPRQRLTESLRYMLDRPELADLVIPDLARWEDWSVIPKLVDLFAKADDSSSWVRVPVINYLRACPLPIAEEKIELLKTIDAEAVKRAMTFFPVVPDKKKDDSAKKSETKPVPKKLTSGRIPKGQTMVDLNDVSDTQRGTTQVSIAKGAEVADTASAMTPQLSNAKDVKAAVRITPPATIKQIESEIEKGANPLALLAVTTVCGLGCFIAMRWAIGIN